MLQKCTKEVKYCIHAFQRQQANTYSVSLDSLKKLEGILITCSILCLEMFEELKGTINNIKIEEQSPNINSEAQSKGIHKPGTFLFEVFKKVNIDEESYPLVSEIIEGCIEIYTQSKVGGNYSFG